MSAHPIGISIRPARLGDAATLTSLALRSKAHWGYSKAFMAACAKELAVSPEKINAADLHYAVALNNEAVVGFSAVEQLTETRWELEALFVEPDRIGGGIGHYLLRHAAQLAAALGATTLVIQSDPNAADFYRRAGAVETGARESASIPGRRLPILELNL